MVHKQSTPSQHQAAELDQNHIISWHHPRESCCWPALLVRWCNRSHWCASGKKQGRSWARNCHIFSALPNKCTTTSWSWPSCREVGYDRHLLNLPRGMWIYSFQEMQKMGTPIPYSGFPWTNLKFKTWLHLKMLINTAMPLIISSRPPHQLQWSGNQHVCIFNTTTSSRRFVRCCLPFDWAFSSAIYWSCDQSPQTSACNAQYCSPIVYTIKD